MYSSQKQQNDIILAIYNDKRTVFRLKDIAMLIGESNFQSLNQKLNYAVRSKKLLNPRKGIYAKPAYKPEELACSIFSPSYISLEFVLQKAGVVFQYDSRITVVSYLSRIIDVGNQTYIFRKIKSNILIETKGIVRQNNQVNNASPERAFLDLYYLEKNYHFDNLNPLNKEIIFNLLPVYQSKALSARVKKLFKNG